MSRALVLKFGGTSLAGKSRVARAASRVRWHTRSGRRVVVVVSAAGATTDRILGHVSAIGAPDLAGVTPVADGVVARAREVDRALATGEERSASLLAIALWRLGVPARSLRGGEAGVEAEGPFGGGRITRIAPGRLHRLLDEGTVPVVSGFQAERADGETVTLGRGGSDTSAVVLAAALGADCHIVTDVEAVCDRDPKLHPDARPYPSLRHEELVALVERGAQVVHPDAARMAADARVPLRIYHYRSGPGGRGGTRVRDEGPPAAFALAGSDGGGSS